MCAALGAIALVLAVVVLLRGARQAPRVGLVAPGALVGVVSVAAMLTGATHVHSHDEAGHVHDESRRGAPGADAGHVQAVDTSTWPRPFDPTQPIDFAGVPGVTPEQQARAETLVASTLQDLPQFADVTKVGALGFTSIGDAASGFEHYINFAYIRDDAFLDPNKPESLVYQVDGDKRTLVAAMFGASGMSLTDPKLVGWGGPLMQWHVHEDLCWSLDAKSWSASRMRPASARPARSTPSATSRWSTCGSHPTSAARSPPSKATAPARSPATAPASTSAPPTTTAVDGRFRELFGETTATVALTEKSERVALPPMWRGPDLRAGVTLPANYQPRGVVFGRRFAIPHALRAGVGGFADVGSALGSRDSRHWA